MSYSDFWFVDTRVQTVNLKRWILWGVLLIAFVSVCTYFCIKSMYIRTNNYEIAIDEPKVTVEEAKKTNANGYIKGNVTNQTEDKIEGKYIAFTFYTKHNIDIGKEYVEIGTLNPQETKTYEAKFRYPYVERFVVTVTDKKE